MNRATPEGVLSSNVRRLLQSFKDRKKLMFYRVSSSNFTGSGRKIRATDKGIADYLVIANGHTYYLELKTEGGKQSDSQKQFEKDLFELGRCTNSYWLARSVLDVQNFLAWRCGIK